MTDAEIAARGQRARLALEEFFNPVIANYRDTIVDRMTEVARNELNSRVMADKLRNLSVAIKVVDEFDHALRMAVKDGEYAANKLVEIKRVEDMPAAKAKLLNIAPRRY